MRNAVLEELLRRRGGSWYTQDANAGTIDAGGLLPTSNWNDNNSGVNGVNLPNVRTVLNISGEYAIRQTGTIKQIDFRWKRHLGANATQQIKFKVFRPLGAGSYRVIDETGWIDETGVNATNVTVSYTGLSLSARVGDFLAVTISSTVGTVFAFWLASNADTAGTLYKDGAEPTGDVGSWTTLSANLNMQFIVYMDPPMIACCGDSIIRGSYSWDNHNTAAGYDVVTYDLTNDPAYLIAAQLGGVSYQNGAIGSSYWANQNTHWVPPMIAVLPRVLVMSVGINDILTEVTAWEDALTAMNAVKTKVDAASLPVHLAVAEVLPCTIADDTEAGTIRTWNANYAAWCATNGATLLRCHDALGKVRATTGELDDIADAYDHGDGIHLSAAGLAAHAAAMAPDLKGISL